MTTATRYWFNSRMKNHAKRAKFNGVRKLRDSDSEDADECRMSECGSDQLLRLPATESLHRQPVMTDIDWRQPGAPHQSALLPLKYHTKILMILILCTNTVV